jgi:hypothetical protein
MLSAAFVVTVAATIAVAASLSYFRRVELGRPALGVFNLTDVGVLVALIIAMPYLYLALPIWAVSSLLGLGLLSTLLLACEPVLGRAARWTVVLALLGADVAAVTFAPSTRAAFIANDLLAVSAVVAVTNLWGQSGLKARDATVLAVVLAVYDPIATSFFSLTGDLFRHLAQAPFAPLIAFPVGEGRWFALGIGDVLVTSLLSLNMTKAFGEKAGLRTAWVNLAAIWAVIAVTASNTVHGIVPVMVLIGPLAALNYQSYRRRSRRERTTYEFRNDVAARPPPGESRRSPRESPA